MATLRALCLFVSVLLVASFAAYSQTTLTGAMGFAANSSGGNTNQGEFNTLGGDSYYDLWFALNPDATSPINGPSDAQAAISIPLEVGASYKYYLFTSGPWVPAAFAGLNLFFDGNSSTPGISVFGAMNHSSFAPNRGKGIRLADVASSPWVRLVKS